MTDTDHTAKEWERESDVECVSCPSCAFTFDAIHTDEDGGYSCPACAEISLTAALEVARQERDEARESLRIVVKEDGVVVSRLADRAVRAETALREIEAIAGAAGAGEVPAMPIARIARAALAAGGEGADV